MERFGGLDTTCRGNSKSLAKVFDLELPLEATADGYRAMDERRAIKVLLRP
jgi:hypothetical protein